MKIVKQILVSHLPSLRGIKVSPRMAHEKSKEMAEKSEVVKLLMNTFIIKNIAYTMDN